MPTERIWASLSSDNVVTGIWSRSYGPLEPLTPPAPHVVDVTGVTPVPKVGDTYIAESNAFTPPAPPPLTPLDRVQQALLSGVQVTSTSNPALSGVYFVSQVSLTYMTGVSLRIVAGRGVPGGGSTFNFFDAENQPHAFTGPEFLDFSTAVSDFVASSLDFLNGVPGATEPTQPIAIP